MSIIRYTPKQDAFIVSASDKQTLNTGLDEILEIGNIGGTDSCARALLDFGNISLPVGNIIRCTIHLSVAEAHNLIQPNYKLRVESVQQTWTEGYGKCGDCPSTENGVSWLYRDLNSSEWISKGGNFLTGEKYVVETFETGDRKDINIDVTPLFQGGSVKGGFILGFENEEEVLLAHSSISFYSKDTHTIYTPYLEVEIADSEYTSEKDVVKDEQIYITPEGLKGIQNIVDRVRVRLRVSPKYPVRTYSTTSLFKNSHILPETSYWGIQDEYTREMVVNFCEGTKISADSEGSYFDVDFNILEPERYYRLLIQVNLDRCRQFIFDSRNIFKVVALQSTVTLDLPYVTVLPPDYTNTIPYTGASVPFLISTNQSSWNVTTSDPTKFKVSVVSTGFVINVSENKNTEMREAVITVTAGTVSRTFKLIQEAAPVPKEKEFVLVKSVPSTWEGTYLIVWNNGAYATVISKDLEKTVDIDIIDDKVLATEQVRQAAVTISKFTTGYSIQLPDGNFLNVKAASNQVATSLEEFSFTLTLREDTTVLLAGSDKKNVTRVICKNGDYIRGYVGKEESLDYIKPQLYKLED